MRAPPSVLVARRALKCFTLLRADGASRPNALKQQMWHYTGNSCSKLFLALCFKIRRVAITWVYMATTIRTQIVKCCAGEINIWRLRDCVTCVYSWQFSFFHNSTWNFIWSFQKHFLGSDYSLFSSCQIIRKIECPVYKSWVKLFGESLLN